MAAALGTVGFLIASTVLLGLDAAQALHPYLPTRYWLAFVDLFRDPILWRDLVRGLLVQLGYLVVFAWRGVGELHHQGHRRLTPSARTRRSASTPSAARTVASATGSPGRSPWSVREPGTDVLDDRC